LNKNSENTNDYKTKSPENKNKMMNRRNSSIIGTIKETDKDNDDDFNDDNTNSFVPSISNNSRVNTYLL